MKTQKLSNQNIKPFNNRHPTPDDKKVKMSQAEEREKIYELAAKLRQQTAQRANENQELKQAIADMIEHNIEWRDMKFHIKRMDGIDYVEVIDRATGDVLKVIPEPDFTKLANQFKQHPGLTLDIQG